MRLVMTHPQAALVEIEPQPSSALTTQNGTVGRQVWADTDIVESPRSDLTVMHVYLQPSDKLEFNPTLTRERERAIEGEDGHSFAFFFPTGRE